MCSFVFVCVLGSLRGLLANRLHSDSNSQVDPVIGFAFGTLSVGGSIYSIAKTRGRIAQNIKDDEAAARLVNELRMNSLGSCDALATIDLILHSQSQGAEFLLREDNYTSMLSTACTDRERIEWLNAALRSSLLLKCASVDSSSLQALGDTCYLMASQHFTDVACNASPDALTRKLQELDFARFRLDGMMAGLCDGFPSFERKANRITTQSILARASQTSSLVQVDRATSAFELTDPFEVVGLVYSVVGIFDFGLNLYDTKVNEKQGRAFVMDFLNSKVRQDKAAVCSLLSQQWLQVSSMAAWVHALMMDRFHRAAAEMNNLMENWDVENRSEWICAPKRNCLVSATSPPGDDDGKAFASLACEASGYFRVCKDLDVTTIAPIACFAAEFQTKPGTTTPTVRFTFQGRNVNQTACDQPLLNIREADAAADELYRRLRETCA